MVAGSEKLIKMDERRRAYDIVVIGEEPHLAYNRVGLTSYFQHRKAENLYLNPRDWVSLQCVSLQVVKVRNVLILCIHLVLWEA